MENNLYRDKSMESLSAPEELHDYMRVTSPRLWMILGAVVLLLAGFCVYASTATMESTMKIPVDVLSFDAEAWYQEKGNISGYTLVSGRLPASMSDTVYAGMKVRIEQYEGKIVWFGEAGDEQDVTLIIEMDQDYLPLADGTYNADLVLESTTPISLLWN